MHVQTDHHIVPVGGDQMTLFDPAAGQVIVTAERSNGTWVVKARGIKNAKADTRAEAITQMINHALTVLPGEGYSTLVPHGLAELP